MKRPVLITLTFSTLLTGCTPLREVRFDTIQNSSQARANAIIKKNNSRSYKNEEPFIGDNLTLDVIEFDEVTQNHNQRIRILEDMINSMEGIQEANVAIMEDVAIVSINFIEGMSNENIIKVKEDVNNNIREIDAYINNVSITSAPYFVERVNKISMNLEDNNINLSREQQEIITSLRPIM